MLVFYTFWIPFIGYVTCKYLLPFSWLHFSFVYCFLCCAEAFYFDVVSIVYFCFISLASGDISRKMLVQLILETLLPVFSSRIFMVLCLTFKSLIYFEFIFVYGVTKFHSFACSCQVFPTLFVEDTLFFTLYILSSFVED